MEAYSWEEERKQLLERLDKAERVRAESQAEAAVYRDLLEDWHEAANRAVKQNNLSLLNVIVGGPVPFYLPSELEGKEWGKYFLTASMKNARWLRDTKKALEIVRKEADKLLVEDSTDNAEIKEKIIKAAEEGLITHI